MPEPIASALAFANAILGWWLAVLGGPLLAVALELGKHFLKWRVDRRWYTYVIAGAFFIACFLAWRDEHLKVARGGDPGSITELSSKLERATGRRTLSPRQILLLAKELRPSAPRKITIYFIAQESETIVFGSQIADAFDDAGWKVDASSYHGFQPLSPGLTLVTGTNSDPDVPIVERALRAAGLDVKVSRIASWETGYVLTVGYKPE